MRSSKQQFIEEIKKQIDASIQTKEHIIQGESLDVIAIVAQEIINAFNQDKKVVWFGNGGSAADAQHLSCELVSKFQFDRRPLRSQSLTTNTSTLTAVSNDFSFEKVFERQVDAMIDPGDILIGITTSGTSPNVLNALKLGTKKGAITVALTGNFVGELEHVVDYIITVPSKSTPRIQESHITIGHILCYLVEKTLFGEQPWDQKQSLSTETVP
jgi:D-sedoheptulose 7-phosphate isomerase